MMLEGWSLWMEAEHTTIMVSILVATVTIFVGYKWLMKIAMRGKPPLPPGPRGLPLLGNLPFVEPDLHIYFSKLSKKFGPIFKIQMGTKIYVVINSASLARKVLKEDDEIFANRDPPAAAIAETYGGGNILWRPNGPEWRNLRKVLIREMMSKTYFDASYGLRRREVREMVKEIYAKVGSPIKVRNHMFLISLNVVMGMLWGAPLDEDKKHNVGLELVPFIEEAVDLLGKPNISDFFPILAPLDLQGIVSKMLKIRLRFDNIFESVIAIKKSTKTSNQSKDFLQILLELMQQEDEKMLFSMTNIKALLLDIISATTETSSTTVEWVMTELLKNSDIMKKVHEELERVVGNEKIVEECDINQLHYLQSVVKETMRLHPVGPLLIPHSPSVSTTIAGYTIPKGSSVFINVWSIMRDHETWKNPLKFQPERFFEHPEIGDYRGNNFNYLPFGSGRRICAGINLAEKMVMNVLATLLHSFDWKVENATNLNSSEKFGIVVRKLDPLMAIPTIRLPTLEQYY
ncbi:geraniol 8-hydroxylase-like [Carica papaya]|uniref:geraniol 8-hydroxylase-like n=1 Tax=Carica papaya TaxID=3649 RepID=UPI000B8D0DC5|nr:geraniol 8-hydroxylase-like [Carica papaya]